MKQCVRRPFIVIILFISLVLTQQCFANDGGLLAFSATPQHDGSTQYSLNIKILMAMTLLSVLPALLMTMTSFTRILIVLAILRQAMGMPNIPTNQILIGLALLMTLFVMSPVFNQVNEQALQPYLQQQINDDVAISKAVIPFKEFMLKQTRQADLAIFSQIAHQPPGEEANDLPIPVIMIAFITSELKTAFQIGFFLFIPFLIIDLVVASILMSMGMMMLSPLVISLPFKIMLFVLVNGWALIMGSLSSSFGVL